uniref:Hydrolase CocE/NonD family protein n=1 Tax=Toxoplasma gondii COUG TaxID=1074873 RepID=A0A2G8Y6Y6_TOXGO|nr:hydrolase CocE/NonD family protein [Toxoplasma gondii COUG]
MEPCSEKPHRPRPRLENSTSPCESEQSTLSTSVGSFSPCCAAGSTTTVSVTPVVDDSPSADGSSSRVTTSRAALSPVDKADFRGSQGRVERGADDTRKQTRLKSDLKRRPRLSAQFLLPSGIEGYSKNVSYSKHGSATPAHAGRLSDAVDSLARELERLQERRRLTASTLLPSILAELNLSPRADMQGLKLLSASGTLGVVNPRIRSSPAKASSRHLDFAGKLDMLTKQLLVFSYSFVAFHTLTLHFCPSVYSALRFGPELNTDPLLHQPHPDSLFGFFFFFMNTSIQVFVKRGVSAALIHAGLLHLARLAIVRGKGPQKPSSKNTGKLLKNDQGLSTTPLAHRRYHENINQQTKGSKERIDYVTRSVPYSPTSPPVTTTLVLPSSYTPTSFSAPSLSSIASPLRSQLPHRHGQYGWSEESCLSSVPSRSPAQVRRRMRFVSRILAVACCLSLFVTVTAFLWGGWPAKAVGFPDIYLGALTKKGSFTGPENLRSVLRSTTAEATLKRIKAFRQESMVSPSMNSRSLLEKWSLDASKGLLYYRMVVFFVLGFLLDAWGAWTKVRLIRQFLKLRDLIIPGLIFTVAMSYAAIHLQGFPSCNAKDRHWVDFRAEELAGNVNTSTHDKINTPPLLYSVYIPMRDGVELAADVYLPKPYYETAEQLAAGHHRIELLEAALRKTKKRLETLQFQESHSGDKGEAPLFSDRIVGREPKKTIFKRYQEIRNLIHFQTHVEKRIKDEQEEYNTVLASVKKLPTYLDITRYNRRTQVYWPLSMLRMWKNPRGATVNLWSFPAQQAFTANGYAVVVVDSRGTG